MSTDTTVAPDDVPSEPTTDAPAEATATPGTPETGKPPALPLGPDPFVIATRLLKFEGVADERALDLLTRAALDFLAGGGHLSLSDWSALCPASRAAFVQANQHLVQKSHHDAAVAAAEFRKQQAQALSLREQLAGKNLRQR